jgi:hypothetical protein
MVLGSTQPLVEMSTRNISWEKRRPVREFDNLTMKIWEPKPPGTLWATPGLYRDCFTYTVTIDVRCGKE